MTRPLAELLGPSDSLTELEAAHAAAWSATDPALLELCRRRMAMLLRHGPTLDEMTESERVTLAAWPDDPALGSAERAALELTEQFVIDVATATDEQVTGLADHLGDRSVIDFVDALLVVEQRMRLELGLGAVLGPRA